MRRSHADPEVESYLRKAERGLATAVRMSESGSEFANIICFHAEQCAEKALKGLMLALRQVPPRTHDLVIFPAGSNRPRLEGVALACPAQRGDSEQPSASGSVSESGSNRSRQ